MVYLGGGSVYNTSDKLQDRKRLTGTPLGVELAIVLFIHEIAFVNIWPKQQPGAKPMSTLNVLANSLDIRYNKCQQDAHEQVSNAHIDRNSAQQ